MSHIGQLFLVTNIHKYSPNTDIYTNIVGCRSTKINLNIMESYYLFHYMHLQHLLNFPSQEQNQMYEQCPIPALHRILCKCTVLLMFLTSGIVYTRLGEYKRCEILMFNTEENLLTECTRDLPSTPGTTCNKMYCVASFYPAMGAEERHSQRSHKLP